MLTKVYGGNWDGIFLDTRSNLTYGCNGCAEFHDKILCFDTEGGVYGSIETGMGSWQGAIKTRLDDDGGIWYQFSSDEYMLDVPDLYSATVARYAFMYAIFKKYKEINNIG